MFLVNQEIMYWTMFVILNLIALFPMVIYLIAKNTVQSDNLKRFAKWAVRAIICDLICLILFIFIPSIRTKIIIACVLLILLNGLLFKKNL